LLQEKNELDKKIKQMEQAHDEKNNGLNLKEEEY
jgi:hypothetical protein